MFENCLNLMFPNNALLIPKNVLNDAAVPKVIKKDIYKTKKLP